MGMDPMLIKKPGFTGLWGAYPFKMMGFVFFLPVFVMFFVFFGKAWQSYFSLIFQANYVSELFFQANHVTSRNSILNWESYMKNRGVQMWWRKISKKKTPSLKPDFHTPLPKHPFLRSLRFQRKDPHLHQFKKKTCGCQPKNRGKTKPKMDGIWMVKIRETPIFKWMIWGVENPYFWVDTHVPGDSFWPFYGWWVSSRDPFKWLSDVKWLPTFGDEKITVIESPDMESSPEMFFSERSVWKKHVFVGSCFKRAIYSDHSPPVGHPKWWFSKGIPPKWP